MSLEKIFGLMPATQQCHTTLGRTDSNPAKEQHAEQHISERTPA